MRGYVYLFAADGGLYKIGKSRDPWKRLKSFRTLPWNVKVAHIVQVEEMEKWEQWLHGKFARKRVKGEWFRLSVEDVKWLQGLLGRRELSYVGEEPVSVISDEPSEVPVELYYVTNGLEEP